MLTEEERKKILALTLMYGFGHSEIALIHMKAARRLAMQQYYLALQPVSGSC